MELELELASHVNTNPFNVDDFLLSVWVANGTASAERHETLAGISAQNVAGSQSGSGQR